MKTRKVLSVVLVVAMLLTFAACGKKTSSPAGTYVLESMTSEGVTMKMEDLAALGMSEDDFKLILNEDGTGSMEVYGQSQELTWDDKTLTAEGESIAYTLSGDTLTISVEGNSMVFVRK